MPKNTMPKRSSTQPTVGNTGMIRARVSPVLKTRVEYVLAKVGLTPSDAIRLFYSQIVLCKGIPFEVRIPNAVTRAALHEADHGIGLVRYKDTDEMFKKLGIEDDTA